MAFLEENQVVPLYIELPHVGRKNQPKKKGDPNHTWKPKDNASTHSQYHHVIERESSSSNFEYQNTRLLGENFTTQLLEEIIYQDKIVSSIGDTTFKPNMSKEVNQRLGYMNTLNARKNLGQVPYIE